MNQGEHSIMAEIEEYHWWYRSLRGTIQACLETPRFALPEAPRILDAGCGTGANLRALAEFAKPSYLGGFDPSEEGLEFSRAKAPTADIYQSDLCEPEIHEDELDLVISMDVVYIPGVEQALQGLRRIANALRPGGLFMVNLPAYDWLFSQHDIAIHTRERYTAASVGSMLSAMDLQIDLMSYRVCFLFPAVVAARLPSMFRGRNADPDAKSDLYGGSGGAGNEALYQVMAAESRLVARGLRLPWGSSVFAIGRRV